MNSLLLNSVIIMLMSGLQFTITPPEPVYMGTQVLKEELKSVTVSLFSMGDGREGTCSGTIINEVGGNHHILTAKHCIYRTDEFYVDNNKTNIIFTSVKNDLAYIIVDGKIKGKKVAKLSYKDGKIRDFVHHLGYPEEHMYLSSGFIYRISDKNDFAYIQAINGCSGGGIFNNKTELVGVLWGVKQTRKGTASIFEPVRDIREFLKIIEEFTGIKYYEVHRTFINKPDPKPENTNER